MQQKISYFKIFSLPHFFLVLVCLHPDAVNHPGIIKQLTNKQGEPTGVANEALGFTQFHSPIRVSTPLSPNK